MLYVVKSLCFVVKMFLNPTQLAFYLYIVNPFYTEPTLFLVHCTTTYSSIQNFPYIPCTLYIFIGIEPTLFLVHSTTTHSLIQNLPCSLYTVHILLYRTYEIYSLYTVQIFLIQNLPCSLIHLCTSVSQVEVLHTRTCTMPKKLYTVHSVHKFNYYRLKLRVY